MLLYADLHIHSGLSPCGDNDMTPNNILNMAKIKGLDVIAITDHNTAENVSACMDVGIQTGIIVIPGIELQTREEVHVLCMFPSFERSIEFQKYIYSKLPKIRNNERLFGEQLLFNKEDMIIGKNEKLLLTSADISLDDAFYAVNELNGVFIPAHIDKPANSILTNLGFIPDYLNIRTIEYISEERLDNLINTGVLHRGYNFINSSDAHYLGDILEPGSKIEVYEPSIEAIIKQLKGQI